MTREEAEQAVLVGLATLSHSERSAIVRMLNTLHTVPCDHDPHRVLRSVMDTLPDTNARYQMWLWVGITYFGIQPDSIRRKWSKVPVTSSGELHQNGSPQSPDSVTTTTIYTGESEPPDDGSQDPNVHKICAAIRHKKKLYAAVEDVTTFSEGIFSSWPAFKPIDPALVAINEAELDTPVGEPPAFTRQRIRKYIWGAAQGKRGRVPVAEEPPDLTPELLAEWKRKRANRE